MKKKLSLLTLTALLAVGFAVSGEVDFQNCGVCKAMANAPGLMENVSWESHEIATGMLSVTVVNPDFEKVYAAAHDEMLEAVARMKSGEQMELCPFCTRMGQLAAAGANIENFDAGSAHFMVITSEDSATIDKIHAHLEWTQKAFDGDRDAHEGHDHKG